MKYIIVSIYDGGYHFATCNNGEITYDGWNYYSNCEEYRVYINRHNDLYDWLLEQYSDYDFIVVCEDGDIHIVKGPKQ